MFKTINIIFIILILIYSCAISDNNIDAGIIAVGVYDEIKNQGVKKNSGNGLLKLWNIIKIKFL